MRESIRSIISHLTLLVEMTIHRFVLPSLGHRISTKQVAKENEISPYCTLNFQKALEYRRTIFYQGFRKSYLFLYITRCPVSIIIIWLRFAQHRLCVHEWKGPVSWMYERHWKENTGSRLCTQHHLWDL